MNIAQHGYELKASKPNAEGLCMFRLINTKTKEEIKIDRRCTLEEALSAAWRYVENEVKEKKKRR